MLDESLASLIEHADNPSKIEFLLAFDNDDKSSSKGWDTTICSQENRFCIQAFDTHNKHPYSIFPIVPRAWFDQLGHLSQHPLNDAYISQIAWLLDIMVRIPIRVEHRRFDLTGENHDMTFAQRNLNLLEGNPKNPQDFNYLKQREIRIQVAHKIATYLAGLGYDMTHWNEAATKKRDPWANMLAADVNKQMVQLPTQ